jgi:Cd2+/Zn2+-exporting ATPase
VVGIDALVTIAVLGAMAIGEYWEGAAVTFLFMLGDYLEARTIEKTRSSIKALLDMAPSTARVRRDGEECTVGASDVVLGDIVVVRPGERIAVDGTVLEGSAYVDQSAITGESIPVRREAGDHVFSGTIPDSGYLVLSADRVGEDTTFARILQLVEDAQDKKARTQQFLEKFSRFYTPGIIVLAVVLFAVTRDLVLALTLLVIACPGALVISTPVSIVAGIGNGARHGVLVKGGDVMEKLGAVQAVAFDKTGTLTVGRPEVLEILPMDPTFSVDDILRLAAIGESFSEHPLARAIQREADLRLGRLVEKPSSTSMIAGQGLVFTLDGRSVLLGNRKLFADRGIDLEKWTATFEAQEDRGRTLVLVGEHREGAAGDPAMVASPASRLLGLLAIADRIRPEARSLVADLKSQGIRHVAMLTGDNPRAAHAIALELGLDGVHSELLPEDKVRVLGEIQKRYGRVAMVGDGVNDAPALASADLGIAIGGAGSDVAMETADVVLLSADIGRLSYAIGLSRATVRNMKQNIAFAVLVATLLLAGVLVRTVDLSFGMLVHETSVLLVVVNAVRLLGYKGGRRARRLSSTSK